MTLQFPSQLVSGVTRVDEQQVAADQRLRLASEQRDGRDTVPHSELHHGVGQAGQRQRAGKQVSSVRVSLAVLDQLADRDCRGQDMSCSGGLN